MRAGIGRRELLVSKGWVQAVALVVLFGFFVLGLLAYRAYSGQPPIPDRVVDPSGRVIFTGEDVTAGQGVFLKNGLMQYGSIFGHGAYLGPDYTADYLRRSALSVRESYGGEDSDVAAVSTVEDFKENRYDSESRTLEFSAAQAAAFGELRGYYEDYFGEPTTRYGLRPEAIRDPEEIRQLTSYFAWTAWAAAALRPGLDYTYTNNWPPEPLVENEPTGEVVVWSVLSLVALLGGIGLLFAAFGRWNFLGWRGREQATLSFRVPGDVALTPAQRACAWFFLVMAALFLIQTLVGAASEHYRADLAGFFGIDLAQVLPYNLMRTWHVQLAIFWVATSFLAAGIFLAPMISGREPRGQHFLAYGLLGALAVVVFGSMIGEWLGIFGFMGGWWSWFGNQGFEYLDLGRFWQVLLSIGLFFWVTVLFRGLRGRLRREHAANMPWLFFFAALAIPAFYTVGLLARLALHDRGFLAVLDRAPVGGGLSGTLHHRHGRLHLRSARGGKGEGGPDRHLPGHTAVFGGGGDRDHALPLLFGYARGAHGSGRVLLGGGGDPLDLPDRRSVELFAARGEAGVALAHAVPAPLGGHVPGGGRVLELPGGGDLRVPDQPPHCLLLPDRHGAYRQPRPRGDDGRLRDARCGPGPVLPAVPDPRRALVGASGEMELLVPEHWARLDVLRHALPPWHPAALSVRERRVLRGPQPGVHHQRHERSSGVDEAAWGRGVYRRGRAAAAVPVLPGRAPHRPTRDVGGA